MKNISWNTKKIETGFEAKVYEIICLDEAVNGQYVKQVTLKVIIMPTRARAKAAAQKWVRYLKAA